MIHYKANVSSNSLMPCLILPPRRIIVSSSPTEAERLKVNPHLGITNMS